MSNPPHLTTSRLPTDPNPTTTSSPARGAEMTHFLRTRLLNRDTRAPPLVHSWDFWHDRQDRSSSSPSSSSTIISTPPTSTTSTPAPLPYSDRLEHLAPISDVRDFWAVFNHFDISALHLRDSIHLFHRGIQPVWEHERNARGGAWTFRVSKAHAAVFWQEVCLLAIGEALQKAVETPDRAHFRDDICGVSLSVRFTSVLVQVWNRDGANEEGIERVRCAVVEGVKEEVKPREGAWYYKRHAEHKGFNKSEGKGE